MEKPDFKKNLDAYQGKHHVLRTVEVPPLQYLMIDGQGDPNTDPRFAQAVATLFPLAYQLKFFSKNTLQRDYVVMPLEGLWWADDYASFTRARDKSKWHYTLMIMQPGWISAAHFQEALAAVARKSPELPLDDVRLQTLHEGLCVQTLHIGSFDDEAAILAQMHENYLPQHHFKPRGKHHEIYFSDMRKTPPHKLRTLLRQPVSAHCPPRSTP